MGIFQTKTFIFISAFVFTVSAHADTYLQTICVHKSELAGDNVYLFQSDMESDLTESDIKKAKWNKPVVMTAKATVLYGEKDNFLNKFQGKVSDYLESIESSDIQKLEVEGKWSYAGEESGNFKGYHANSKDFKIAFGYRKKPHHVLIDQNQHVSHASMICEDIEFISTPTAEDDTQGSYEYTEGPNGEDETEV